ncbi:MAG: hypothetical protein ACRERR_01005 [Moraxellaceae bacterium]
MRFSSLTLPFLLLSSLAVADTAPTPHPQEVHQEAVSKALIQATRTQINAERQQAITLSLPLSPTESDAFWPLYREYHGKIDLLNDRFYALVMEYAKSYPDVSDEKAKAFLKEYNDIDGDRVSLRGKYAKKFLKVIPATKVARYLQIEHRLDVLEALDASSQIPLVKPSKGDQGGPAASSAPAPITPSTM